jgi:hypothetical protein
VSKGSEKSSVLQFWMFGLERSIVASLVYSLIGEVHCGVLSVQPDFN